MRRVVLALIGSLALIAGMSSRVAADVNTLVGLSCNDGHSVIESVDLTTLTSLTADVQSILASNTGLSCTLDTLDPSSESTEWTVYDYNPSGHAIAPRNSPKSMPATTPDNGVTWQFPFKPDIY